MYGVDFSNPADISIPLRDTADNVTAWYVSPPKFEAVMNDKFIGDVSKGGKVNFRNIFFNPHGNGTHTECLGHISKEKYTIHQCLTQFFFLAELITVVPENNNSDKVITKKSLEHFSNAASAKAIIIRTLPNNETKLSAQYSNTNPVYMSTDAVQLLNDLGIEHLLIDTPSIDREEDGGVLAAHHLFWNYPDKPILNKTITELIYVPNEISDGLYLLNLQIASFENDASPSKPVLYSIWG